MDAAALRIKSARHDAAAGTLTIEWGDGLRAVYPLSFLRTQCPCATCRDMKEKASQQAADQFRVLPANLLQPSSEMSGVELHQALASGAPTVAERMVFLTGGAFTPVARAFLNQVKNHRVDKPFSSDELRELVRRLVAAP